MKTVLLIDDDRLPMQYYVRALQQRGFEVKQCYDPDTTLEFIKKKQPKLAAIVLDIMMLPGKEYQDKNTDEGLKTGVFLYDDLRTLCPNVPVVVLTNVSNPETLQHFQEGPGLKVVQKLDYPPFMLAELVSDMVKAVKKYSATGEREVSSNGN